MKITQKYKNKKYIFVRLIFLQVLIVIIYILAFNESRLPKYSEIKNVNVIVEQTNYSMLYIRNTGDGSLSFNPSLCVMRAIKRLLLEVIPLLGEMSEGQKGSRFRRKRLRRRRW